MAAKGAHLLILCFIALWSSVRPTAIKFEDCGSAGEVKEVNVDPCNDPNMCTFYTGSVVHANLTFVPTDDATSLTLRTYAIFGNTTILLPSPDSDACKNSGIQCPLKGGSSATYQKQLTIPSSLPEINALLRIELRDQKQRKVVCIKIMVRVVKQ
uniref:ML domain-containing protein n=1 Tax=Trichuris muris TaxID=70415 RepID=A0A5S6QYZ6_TRIMR